MLYFLLAANFLAAIQLIVYAGGTLVLLIFGVMLTNKSPWVSLRAAQTGKPLPPGRRAWLSLRRCGWFFTRADLPVVQGVVPGVFRRGDRRKITYHLSRSL